MARPRLGTIFVLVAVALIGVGIGQWSAAQPIGPSGGLSLPSLIHKLTPKSPTSAATFESAWNTIHQQYVNSNLDDQKLVQGAISGLVNAVGDPYTTFFPPVEATSFQNEISGTFEGVGMEIGVKNNLLTVISPLAGSPAEKAGVLSGDVITKIDTTDTEGLALDAAVEKIRGKTGTTVILTIQRGTATPITLSVTRKKITVDAVTSKVLDHAGGPIGYVRISSFTEQVNTQFRDQVTTLLQKPITGLVIDLRNDPGGFLDQAVQISSAAIPSGTIVSEIGRDGKKHDLTASGNPILANTKIVVLVNKGSASASEIVAGALQDTKRATIIGETTFGKGSVQELEQLSDGSSLKYTVAKWYTPNGRSIHELGITPDTTVVLTADDVAAGRDPQLDAAVRLLTGK